MRLVRGHPVFIVSANEAAVLYPLLAGVMTGFAECLPIALIPEQGRVTSVGADMVNHGVGTAQGFPAHRA